MKDTLIHFKTNFEKLDFRLFCFVILLCIIKYLVFSYFDNTAALFSADFIIGNVLIAIFLKKTRNLFLFIFNAIYFLVFISLTFSNFFHFSLRSLIDSLKFYEEVSLAKYIQIFLLIGGCILAIIMLIRYVLSNRRSISLLNLPLYFLFLGVMYLLQAAVFTDYRKYVDVSHTQFKKTFPLVSKGDLMSIVLADKKFAFGYNMKNELEPLTGDKASSFMRYASADKQSQIFVLIESMGKFTSGPFKTIIQDSIAAWTQGKYYNLVVDSVQFQGTTIDGEMRELFSLKGDYNKIITSEEQYPSLFSQLKGNGYTTYSVSSSSGKVFSDRLLYKKAGCEKSYFREELTALPQFNSKIHVNQESAFSGVSDRFTFDFLVQIFRNEKPNKTAAYFLTINTHLPFELDAGTAGTVAYKSFEQQFSQYYDSEVLGHTFKLLADLKYYIINSMAEEISSIMFVGDHSPPFFQAAQREKISQTQVPVYVITKSE